MMVNDQLVDFEIDSGADAAVLPVHTCKKLENTKHKLTHKVSLGPWNYKLYCTGKFTAKLTVNKLFVENDVYVVKDLERPLLSRFDSHIESSSLKNGKMKTTRNKLFAKYPRIFKGLRKIAWKYSISRKYH